MIIPNQSPPRRKPQGNGWSMIGISEEYTAWKCGEYCALSASVFLSDEHLPPHWEWLVSFSKNGGQRVSNGEIEFCLKAFDALDFEEDNHENGMARKFWYAVEQKYRVPCPCKDEKVITEGDYQYSVKKD